MKANRKTYIISLVISVLAIALIATVFNFNSRERKLIKEAQIIITIVEAYRTTHGHYPKTLADVGIPYTERSPLHYQLKDSVDYILYFSTSLGESKIYYSDSKTWEERFR
jgi:hypothetical protein